MEFDTDCDSIFEKLPEIYWRGYNQCCTVNNVPCVSPMAFLKSKVTIGDLSKPLENGHY